MIKKNGKQALVWLLAIGMIFSTIGVASAKPVTDIKDHWAEKTITSWLDRDLAFGYEDHTFRTEVKINRQEFVALVNRSFGYVESGIIQFTDVEQSDWSYLDISKAIKAQYVSGYPDGTFKPKQELSRQEVAVIIANVLGLKTSASVGLYTDAASIPQWSKGAISAVKDYAIMSGYPDGTFRPLQTTTRAEAVVILDRALKLQAELDNGVPTPTPIPSPTPTPEPTPTPAPVAGSPNQPILGTATVSAGANVTIAAPAAGVTAWLAPAGTTKFAAAANMTSLAGNGMAAIITAPTTPGAYKLFLVNTAGTSLASVGTLTVGIVAAGISPVNLGIAGNYVILSKTGISSVPNSKVTGNIGVSPIDSTAITGFSLTADATNEFSTSNQITGKVYASDYTTPTSSLLTTAISNMETAYTDAAGRAVNYTELHSGDISGQTLTSGVYKWGTSVMINSNVTLHGGANDVFILQIAGGITQASGTRVILTGGVQAKNIFWQTAGTVSIGTNAHFEGIVLSKTNITLGTNASINGRLLAQTAVTLDQSTVVAP